MGVVSIGERLRRIACCWLAVYIVLTIPACGAKDSETRSGISVSVPLPSSTTVNIGSIAGTWLLESMTVEGQQVALPTGLSTLEYPDVAGWIRFDDGLVDGELPCNHFAGDYNQQGATIVWEIVQDSGFCLEPEGVMDAEQPMTDLIFTDRVDVRITDDQVLEIIGADVAMTFHTADG